jgi:bla regulator protein blaR1
LAKKGLLMIPRYFFASVAAIPPAVANHLWQSTLFGLAIAVLTLALRQNQARIRYRLWIAASIKFLIPFSLLISLGNQLARPGNSVGTRSGLYSTAVKIGRPFVQTASLSNAHTSRGADASDLLSLLPQALWVIWVCGCLTTAGLWWLRWRRIAVVVRGGVPLLQGREVEALRRLEQIAGVRSPITLLLSEDSLEPGIFGVVQPTLVWPAGISEHLTDAHLQAIVAHEVWHVHRRDNLTAMLHMAVSAIFWFHPLIWWLGERLLEERERACDEEVLQLGNAPQVYAESILKTCEFCVGSPLACVSGVTGADLKNRIARIMIAGAATRLNLGKKMMLVAAGAISVALPIWVGVAYATQSHAALQGEKAPTKLPAYEVVSIKLNKSENQMARLMYTADGFNATNIPLKGMIQDAYGLAEENQIVGAPSWLSSERYDLEAKVDSSDVAELHALDFVLRRQMLQPVLAERLQLKAHLETRELMVYALVIGKNGSKLHEAKPGDTYAHGLKGPDGAGGPGMTLMTAGQLTSQGISISDFTRILSQRLGSNVLDRTGLTGKYDISMQWPEDNGPAAGPPGAGAGEPGGSAPVESTGPSIFSVIQEQLGLKLEAQKAPVEVLVIDHVERPSAN